MTSACPCCQDHLDTPGFATYQQVLEESLRRRAGQRCPAGIGYVGRSRGVSTSRENGAAGRHITESIPLCRPGLEDPATAAGLGGGGAVTRQANGRPGGAPGAIAEASRYAPSRSIGQPVQPIPAQRAPLLLAPRATSRRQPPLCGRGERLRTDDEPICPKNQELVPVLTPAGPGPARRRLALLDQLQPRRPPEQVRN